MGRDYLEVGRRWGIMRKDRFNVGDVLVKKEKGQEPIHRKITAVRDSGYSWIYVDDEREIEFYSEDSSDPFFEWKWELIDMSENKIGKEDLYPGYYLTNDERLGSFQGYKTDDEKIIVALVDILNEEKFCVDADEIRRLNHDEVLYFANKMRSEIKMIKEPDYDFEHEYKEKNLKAEEIEVIYDWLTLAIHEGGGVYGDELRAWFPIIQKLMPPSTFKEIAWFFHLERDTSIALEFLEYVGQFD